MYYIVRVYFVVLFFFLFLNFKLTTAFDKKIKGLNSNNRYNKIEFN